MTLTLLAACASLFGLYFMTSSLELGTGIIYLLNVRSKETRARPSAYLFSSLWEFTNLLLLGGFVGAILFFKSGLSTLVHDNDTRYELFIGLIALLMRILVGIYLFKRNAKKQHQNVGLLYVFASIIVPLSLGVIGVHLLIGQTFWQSSTGLAMAVTLLLSLLALALTFARAECKTLAPSTLRNLARILSVLFCVVAGLGLQVLVNRHVTHLLSWPYDIFIIGSASVTLVQVSAWLVRRERLVWWYLAVLIIGSSVLLALANRPYLIYPIQLTQISILSHVYNNAFAYGFLAAISILFVGFVFVYWFIVIRRPKYDTRNSHAIHPPDRPTVRVE